MLFPGIDTADLLYSEIDDISSVQFSESEKEECIPLVQKIIDFSRLSLREGFLALEDKLENEQDIFLKNAMKLVVDGCDTRVIRKVLKVIIQAEKLAGSPLLGKLIVAQGIDFMLDGEPTSDVASKLFTLLDYGGDL
jgi:hypothetical protein